MLTEILKKLEEGCSYSQSALAKMFGVSEERIVVQIEFLEIQGYLNRVTIPSCSKKTCIGCKGCGGEIKAPVMWEIKKIR